MAKSHDHNQKSAEARAHLEPRTEAGLETSPEQDAVSGEASELLADLQRVQAEFVNYRRHAETEKAELMDFAKNRIVREFLTVRDSFDNELAHRPADVKPEWAAAIDAIRTQFDKVM